MAKFQVVVLFVAVAFVASTHAEPQRRRTRVQFARQQAAEETPVTPYPSADELKPEVAFDEAAGGPPADLVPQADDAFAAVPEARNVPDEVYGPPENELAVEAAEPAAEQFADAEQARVVAALRVAKLRQRQAAVVASKRAANLKAATNNKQH